MRTLTSEDILDINKMCPLDMGVFCEPFGIPDDIKEHVVYMRWINGGIKGGSCWGTKHHDREPDPKPRFKALDLVLKFIKPDLTFLQFREIEELIQSSEKTEFQYYGNRTEHAVEFIVLSDLYKKLQEIENEG